MNQRKKVFLLGERFVLEDATIFSIEHNTVCVDYW